MRTTGTFDPLARAGEAKQRANVVTGRQDVARDRVEHIRGKDPRFGHDEAVTNEPHQP